MVKEGARMGLRKRILARMMVNTGLDMVIGAIPIVGDVFDMLFKSHQRNMALIQDELALQHEDAKKIEVWAP